MFILILLFVVLFGCGPSLSNDDTVIDTTNLNQNPDRVNKNITEESIKSLSIAEANKLYKQYQNNKILQGDKNKKLVQTLKNKCVNYTKVKNVDTIKPELIDKPYELDNNKLDIIKNQEWTDYKNSKSTSSKLYRELIFNGKKRDINLLNTAIENNDVDINKEYFFKKIDKDTGEENISDSEYPIELGIKHQLDTMSINGGQGIDMRKYLLVNRLDDLELPKLNKDKLINFVQTKIDPIKNTYNHCTKILHIVDKYLGNDIFYNDEKNKYNDVKVTEDEIKNLKLDENNKTFEEKQGSIIKLIDNLVNNKQITSDLIKNNLGNKPLFYLSEDEDFGNVFKDVGSEKKQYDLRKRLIALFLNQYDNGKLNSLSDFNLPSYYSLLGDLLMTYIDYGEVYHQYVYDLFKLFCTSANIHEKMKNKKDEIKQTLKKEIKEKQKQIAYLKGVQEAIKKIKEK